MTAFFPIYLKNYDIIRWAGTRFAVYFASDSEWRRPLSALRATLPEGESLHAYKECFQLIETSAD